jgi:uncharacterized protein YndB with AHSA1/START domain
VTCWRQQAIIEAPVETIWELIGDPSRHPDWWPQVVEVEGLPRVELDARYRQVTRSPLGQVETTFEIEQLAELEEIRVRCTDTGMYARWLLTPAQEGTFADLETGMEPTSFKNRLFDAILGKRFFRRLTESALDGLRGAVSKEPTSS